MPRRIAIDRLVDLEQRGHDAAQLVAGIDAIFFETAARTFADQPARDAFRHLWLGQYLAHERRHVYLATDASRAVLGYLVGAWDNPARSDRYPALTYFQGFASPCARFPAHLHINLTAAARGQRTGAALVDAFAAATAAAGIPGVHVVTGADSRNVGFYQRNAFREVARMDWQGRPIVFLGRTLPERDRTSV